MFKPSDPWSSIRWLPVKNASGAEMPPFALLRVTGVATDGTITVDRPDTDGKCDLINGPTTVADGAFGQATADSPVVVLYATAGGTPAPGAPWGPAAGSWYLTAAKTGFNAFGGATPQDSPAGTGLVLAARLQGTGATPWCFGPFLSGYDCVDNGDGTFTPTLTWSWAHFDGTAVTVNTTPCP